MSEKMWFQKSLRRLLVDMHIPDWNDDIFLRDFSPENYAGMMALAKVTTAEIYAGSCLGLCYWPTKVGFRHKQLHGRDLLGETINACCKRDIAVQIYLNVWNRAAYDAHPEWRVITHNGRGTCENNMRYGLCCPNTGFGEYFLHLLDELNSMYECSGFWIDMIGNYYHCYCQVCQKRFLEETSITEIPRIINWNDPGWLMYDRCRSRWLNEFAEKIYSTVKRRKPERTVTLQTASIGFGRESGIGEGFLCSSDYLAGDFTGDALEQSYICKYFHSISKNHPIEFMTPRCENLAHHTTERTFENLLMRSFAALTNQASFTLIDAIDPRGTLDRRFYEHAGRINDSYALFEKYIDGDSEALFDIGIYHSLESLMDLDYGPESIEEQEKAFHTPFEAVRKNIVNALKKNHLLFSFVCGNNPEQLKKAPLVILSDCSALSEAECSVLEEYVRNGGRIYASKHTSLYDPERGILRDFRLAKVFGVHYSGKKTHPVTYIAPVDENDIPGSTAAYPLMLESPQLRITTDADAKVLGTLTLPISDAGEINHFGSAISNPPMIAEGTPALVRHQYGKGEVLYVAGNLESVGLEYHREIFVTLLTGLTGGNSLLETNAPQCVECTLFRQKKFRRLVLSCLNLPMELPVLPLRDLYFSIKIPEGMSVKSVQHGPDDTAWPFELNNSHLKIRLENLERFALFTIHY